MATAQKIEFRGHSGAGLAARLDMPNGPVRAYALFAHCFTCSKDFLATRRISAELARAGIAVLRFDFTGLGASEGEFASTNFSSNLADLLSAADYLRRHHEAPQILIGHSLGGAAMLAVAKDVPEARAVVTIAAPADATHVIENFRAHLGEIEAQGEAEVDLSGRKFRIKRQFLEDIEATRLLAAVRAMRKPLLILHSPLDDKVGIDNASAIFAAAKHPKSFVSLDRADHLLTAEKDAEYAGQVIAGWASRYIPADRPQDDEPVEHVRVTETGEGQFQNAVQAGRHRLFADEPQSFGGLDSGPSPYDFLAIALGACTAMTLRMYAERQKLEVGRVSVDVSHGKIHAKDCAECTQSERQQDARIDRFERIITVEGPLSEELQAKILEIADKCPVHRTLASSSKVATRVDVAS